MTLVSFIDGYDKPVIISDRAISESGKKHSVVLPTTNAEPRVPMAVVEFSVKTVILKDILCVGFIGNVMLIERMLEDIIDFFLYRELNSITLRELLEELEYGPSCSVIFALGGPDFDRNRLMVARSGEWFEDRSIPDLHLLSGGTGQRTWTSKVVEKAALLTNDSLDLRFGRQRALLAAMMFTSEERISADNLLDGWGGGFDIIYYENGKFNRYDQVAYIFWKADICDLDNPSPVSVIHNSYVYGNVLVRNYSGKTPQFHVIPGFGQRLPVLPPTYNCASEDVVTCIHIFDGDRHIDDLVVLYHNPNPEAGPAFAAKMADDGIMEYYFNPIYRKYSISALKQHLDVP